MGMSEMKTIDVALVWNSWNYYGGVPDQIDAEGRRNIKLYYYPTIGLYDNSDPIYQEYACQLLKMCYVDGISHHVKGVGDDKHRYRGLKAFVPMSQKYGLFGFVRAGDGTGTQQAWIDAQVEWAEIFSPIALKYNGKEVSSFFSLTARTASDVASVKAAYKAKHGTELYYIARLKNNAGDQSAWSGSFNSGYDWAGIRAESQSIKNYLGYDWYVTPELARTNYNNDVKRGKDLLSKNLIDFYIEGISPGFDDQAVNGWGAGSHYIGRENGDKYKWLWEQAIANNFSMVCIPTWNDYPEGSIIQPSVEFGNIYMELTRTYAARYKGIDNPNTADLMIPEWIFKIRKLTSDTTILNDMILASTYIAQEKYQQADNIVRPYISQPQFAVYISAKYFNPPKSTTAISEQKNKKTIISTVNGSIKVSMLSMGDCIDIFDLKGVKLYSHLTESNCFSYTPSSHGIYFVRVKSAQEFSTTKIVL